MIVYVVMKYKGEKLEGLEVYKTLKEAGIKDDNQYQYTIKRKVVR